MRGAELFITELARCFPIQACQACCLGDVANAGLGDVKSRRYLAGAEGGRLAEVEEFVVVYS
jgi:hypothetical protein